MRLKHLGAVFVVVLLSVVALPSAASAATITLTAVNGNLYQQTIQNPCVFTNPSCTNGGFPGTAVPQGGGVDNWDITSPTYTVSQLLTILNGGSLMLGVDINQADDPQTLELFEMYVNNVLVDSFYFGGTGNVPAGNNGNGYADYLLSNFTPLTNYAGTDTVKFRFGFDDANDGTENVFLISGPGSVTAVPEPATMLLLGTGLLAAARARRKKVS